MRRTQGATQFAKIMRLFLLLALVASALAQPEVTTSTVYMVQRAVTCSTEYSSGGTQPTPLPVSTVTTIQHTTILSATTPTSTSTTEVLAAIVTASTSTRTETGASTVWVQSWTAAAIPTRTVIVGSEAWIGTVTVPRSVCTNGVVPFTITEYSGTYTPVSGQVTALPSTHPALVVCTVNLTTIILRLVAIETSTWTYTETPIVQVWPSGTVTKTVTLASGDSHGEIVTITSTMLGVTDRVAVTSTACAATTTTTYAAKCAPTNLVSHVDGGAVSFARLTDNGAEYVVNRTFSRGEVVAYDHDPSMCCQLCQDNPGCAGAKWDPSLPGSCRLSYAVGPSGQRDCGVAFEYQTLNMADTRIVLQSGCGSLSFRGQYGVGLKY